MIQFFIDNFPEYVDGALVTIRLGLLTFVLACIVGVVIAGFRVSPVRPLEIFASLYVSLFRNTPLLVVFFFALFGLGEIGITFDPFPTAVLALSLYTGAYMAEVVRSGINSVSRGQAEAGRSVGLNFVELLRYVVIPQAVRTVIAPIGNLFIANFKNTAVALTISVIELTAISGRLANRTAQPIAAIVGAAFIYVVILLGAGFVFRSLEGRYAIKR